MVRVVLARSHALVSMVALSGCVLQGPLGGVETDTTGGDTDSNGDTEATTADGSMSTTDPSGTTDPTGDDSVPDVGPAPVGPPKIDILFVIDNSGSMGEEQAALASSIDNLVGALEQVDGISYRVAVTTTDNGNPWCGSTSPEAGKLVASSCRSRENQFVFNGNPPFDATDIACTDICTLDSLPIAATPVSGDAEIRARPWIEGGSGVTNLQGVGVGDALRCMLPQGVAGCGFESPLESAKKAIQRSQTPGEESFGFLREDAHLAVIFVSDETDCSHVAEHQAIFLPEADGGNPSVFWSDPDASAPTSAVCWNAGVVCEGEIPDEGGERYETCRASNQSLAGADDVPDDEAVLHPVGEYVDVFADLLAQKRATSNASVFLYGVMGVPSGYPANPIEYKESADPMFGDDFGIAAGCSSATAFAVPPVRQLAVIESFGYANLAGPQVFSICDPAFGGVYDQLAAQLAPYLGG